MPETKLSIIIVAYNSHNHLERCVTSLYEKIKLADLWEIILVNNDPERDVHELAVDFSRVKIVDHRKNVGFGSGVNLGAQAASGEILFFLNPDTEVLTENVAEVVEELEGNQDIGIIGGRIIDSAGQSQPWSAGRGISFYDLVRNNLGVSRSKFIWSSSRKSECDWVAGTALFMAKELFHELGGFDERFFMYFEDMDLCRRTKLNGRKILFFPDFKVSHDSGASYVDKKLQKRHYYDSMEKYFQKHCSRGSFLAVKTSRKLLKGRV
ncbi:MAG: glycosyltransferase family 2 protein [Candidatus Pacebacteria bacterium]|nr:glycosyltransferase family 2 protein [Candidatus Paceibacterota bacterium]